MKFFLQKQKNNYFIPIDDDDFKKTLKIEIDEIVEVKYWKKRNYEFHKKFFALLNCAIHHLPENNQWNRFRDIEPLRKEVLIQIGHFTEHITLGGVKQRIPNSISFESIDDEEFARIYSRSIDVILKYFLKDITKEDFEESILGFL